MTDDCWEHWDNDLKENVSIVPKDEEDAINKSLGKSIREFSESIFEAAGNSDPSEEDIARMNKNLEIVFKRIDKNAEKCEGFLNSSDFLTQ